MFIFLLNILRALFRISGFLEVLDLLRNVSSSPSRKDVEGRNAFGDLACDFGSVSRYPFISLIIIVLVKTEWLKSKCYTMTLFPYFLTRPCGQLQYFATLGKLRVLPTEPILLNEARIGGLQNGNNLVLPV
jgi:hypothetical protein